MRLPQASDILAQATAYLGRCGWGAQGRSLSISRMLQEADVGILKSLKAVAAFRPRGILSGFLVILPTSSATSGNAAAAAVFVPPVTAKQQPHVVRMRIADPLQKEGAIFSAYTENGDVVLEDVLVWRGKGLFATQGFAERWGIMGEFVGKHWQPDDALQGCTMRLTEYMPLAQLAEVKELEERQVLEIVPLAANVKRFVWVPTADEANAATTQKATVWIAKRESLIGPDVFSLWSATTGEKQPAYGLVRTLTVSKALRVHPVDEFRVNTSWNKMFERWEILGIA